MLMQESIGNVNCHTTIVAHVSASQEDLSESLCTIQIVSHIRRLQRMKVCLLDFYKLLNRKHLLPWILIDIFYFLFPMIRSKAATLLVQEAWAKKKKRTTHLN